MDHFFIICLYICPSVCLLWFFWLAFAGDIDSKLHSFLSFTLCCYHNCCNMDAKTIILAISFLPNNVVDSFCCTVDISICYIENCLHLIVEFLLFTILETGNRYTHEQIYRTMAKSIKENKFSYTCVLPCIC